MVKKINIQPYNIYFKLKNMIFQKLFCKHKYKELDRSNIKRYWGSIHNEENLYSTYEVITFMCEKCNKIKKVKV